MKMHCMFLIMSVQLRLLKQQATLELVFVIAGIKWNTWENRVLHQWRFA